MNQIESLLNDHLRLIDVAEFERLGELGVFGDERVELIHGRVVSMAPMGPLHGWTIQRMTMVLTEYFRVVADVRVQLPVIASAVSMPMPDFLIVRKSVRPAPHPKKAFLAIEVADSSVRFDRVVKAPLYAAGAREYWLVNLRDRTVEVFRKPKRGTYTESFVVRRESVLTSVAFPDVQIPVSAFLAEKRRRR